MRHHSPVTFFRKSFGRDLRIPENIRRLPGIFKNDRIDSGEFRRKLANIIELFKKSPARLPDFFKTGY